MAWTLCTEQDVRDIQPIPDTIPDTWSELVEGMIREHIGQSRLALDNASYTERISGDGTTFLRLRNSPVVSITSVTVDDETISSSNYVTGPYYVQLTDGVFDRGVRNVTVVYTAGGGTATADVRLAAAMMIVAINNYYGRQGADSSLKWSTMMDDGRDHQRGGEDSPSKRVGLASHLEGIMKSMIRQRRLRIA